MREYLVEFLKTLELLVPPPPDCHHWMALAGMDSSLLAVWVADGSVKRLFLIGDEDFKKKPAAKLAGEIAEMVAFDRSPEDPRAAVTKRILFLADQLALAGHELASKISHFLRGDITPPGS